MKYDILIAGVGGQGTVLASRLIAASAIEAGHFARTSETIGMAQRGGCVVSHVRVDSKNAGPIIPQRGADLLIGFEPSEAARNLYRLAPSGKCIINTRAVQPVTASLSGVPYDSASVYEYIKSNAAHSIFVDGFKLAQSAGSPKTLNVVLLGVAVAAGFIPIGTDIIVNTIKHNVSPKYVDMNIRAFNIGMKYKENGCI
jgi:indolepyruvate ferredoxin oxidoreductase beta subunit